MFYIFYVPSISMLAIHTVLIYFKLSLMFANRKYGRGVYVRHTMPILIWCRVSQIMRIGGRINITGDQSLELVETWDEFR